MGSIAIDHTERVPTDHVTQNNILQSGNIFLFPPILYFWNGMQDNTDEL